jgi:EPS-associated MarR family transcriptional regulator
MNDLVRSIFEHMKNNPDQLDVLRAINNKTNITQREMANELGFSLGKLNYVIKALKKKGHIKVKNFKNNKNKINYLYVLTPQGISTKTKLTINFMKLKMQEYDELKKELKKKNVDNIKNK